MSIVDMKQKWSGDEADAAAGEPSSARLAFTIVTDDPSDTAHYVKANAPVPTEHPDDSGMLLQSFRVRRLSPIFHELEALYTPSTAAGQSPTERPVVVKMPPSVSFATTEEPVDVDQQGFALRNVNGEGFDPPCLQEFNDLILTFEKNVSVVDYLAYWDLKGSVASDAFYGFPAGIARCLDITATPAQEGDELFFKQRAMIAFRKPAGGATNSLAWWRRIVSEGFYENIDDKIVRALDDDGMEMTRPVLLDRITGERTDTAQWAYHQKFREVAFASYDLI